ncbi:response regulator [Tropicimonas sediminicola]|uniref:Two-component system, OmpR family, response regulator BaeR n=1 Tax=Tropicimonas sediminicola TaxID=1031541 RepID=A0A239J175_9RHOB|nr:response regulator [Tropicimonas sediminicola]SNS99559.1 two-component system, OmpR family, response regulator BaeR [Tropicimonas sediminicola]
MNESPRILIVEDEPDLAEIICDYIRREGMEAEILLEGRGAVETILRTRPDLVVLDIMLPGKDGLAICREIRAQSDIPIILETARAEEIDRLLGLEIGADDYLCKPFSPRELVARIKAVLRRTMPTGEPGTPPLTMDSSTWRAALFGKPLELTRREFQVLEVLHKRPGRVFSRAQLLELAFPEDADVIDRTIDTHIKNIRSKMKRIEPEADLIRSVYGVGYALDD